MQNAKYFPRPPKFNELLPATRPLFLLLPSRPLHFAQFVASGRWGCDECSLVMCNGAFIWPHQFTNYPKKGRAKPRAEDLLKANLYCDLAWLMRWEGKYYGGRDRDDSFGILICYETDNHHHHHHYHLQRHSANFGTLTNGIHNEKGRANNNSILSITQEWMNERSAYYCNTTYS